MTGIRRCGKSTRLKMSMEELKKRDIPNERILSYRFDSMKYEDIYVTVSNSRMMSSEIATYLIGRYIAFRIYTLSFREYLDFKKEFETVADIKNELTKYIRLS